jgi:hypothetical protein
LCGTADFSAKSAKKVVLAREKICPRVELLRSLAMPTAFAGPGPKRAAANMFNDDSAAVLARAAMLAIAEGREPVNLVSAVKANRCSRVADFIGFHGSQARIASKSGGESKSEPECQLSPVADIPSEWLSSELCHVWTAPGWQELSSRRRLGRCSHVFGL